MSPYGIAIIRSIIAIGSIPVTAYHAVEGNEARLSIASPVVVDKKPGAAGMIGAETASGATPDGYTRPQAD
jgi:hypothetical protein